MWNRVQRARRPNIPRKRTAFKAEEEQNILELVLRFADKGVPLNRHHLCEAAGIFVSTLTEERKSKFRFKNGVPGVRWGLDFLARHRQVLRYAIPDMQEDKRHRAVNATTLAAHFEQLHELQRKYQFTPERVWNLDETGIGPGRDAKGKIRKPVVLQRDGGKRDAIVPAFSYNDCITFSPCISASGDIGPCMYIFKGSQLPYRQILVDGIVHTQTLTSYLPRSSLVFMRPEVASVDGPSFYQFAQRFTEHVADLTSNGQPVLLTYDACRAHIGANHRRGNGRSPQKGGTPSS